MDFMAPFQELQARADRLAAENAWLLAENAMLRGTAAPSATPSPVARADGSGGSADGGAGGSSGGGAGGSSGGGSGAPAAA